MKELWLREDKLVPEEVWMERISGLRSEETFKDKKEAKKQLKEKLLLALKKRIPGEKFGVLFSGGVDSSFIAAICKENKSDFICYTVGFQEGTKEPEDITEAQKVAAELGLKLRHRIYNLKEAEEIIKKTVKILRPAHKTDVVNIGVGAVILAAIELAKEDKISYFLGGLGSEEIFAGYDRHDKAEDKNEECWLGLQKMWSRDLVRDFTLSKSLNVIVRTPFLDEELIKTAMRIPVEWKIDTKEKKIILREVAEEYLGKMAWRKKKAAQYGSSIDKAIAKLAKINGYNDKGVYLRYISKSL